MDFLKNPQIDFMGMRKYAMIFSLTLVTLSLISLFTRGLNFGLDFTGGTVVVAEFSKPVELDKVRQALESEAISNGVAQYFGSTTDVQIRLPSTGSKDEARISNKVLQAFTPLDSQVKIAKVDFIGPQVGKELVEQGALAVIYTILAILIYVSIRFEWRFAVGAVVALLHDVIITMGVFSWLYMDFDLTILAALLAVIGYSLNDTIVVFDRVRENFRRLRKKSPEEIFNISINQTLSRTLITSGTTLLVLIALYLFGGPMIKGFAFALIVGIVIGTYSSIFVASTTALALGVKREDLIPVQKEGADLDAMP
jgi:preprotein translocase subunit SecF